MRDYGKVSAQFWIGQTGKALRGKPEAQVLALYLMTCPHSTMTGVYHCPVLYMAHETGLGMEGASKALQRLIEAGFCEYDEASESVFVIRMAAHQIDERLKPGDRRVLGLPKEVEKMPAPLKERFLQVYGEAFLLVAGKPLASPLQAPCKPHQNQEMPLPSQEQEQEQEQDSCAEPDRLPAGLTLEPDEPKPKPEVVVALPLVGGDAFEVTAGDVAEWRDTFPAVDVPAELKRMRQWLKDTPAKRKTRAGIRRFVSNWLGKRQDQGSTAPVPRAGTAASSPFAGAV